MKPQQDTPELLAPSRRKKPYKYKRQKQRPRIVNPQKKHMDVAKKYLREGKSMAQSMREAGYPKAQANHGIRYQFENSGLMREAFRREMDELCKLADRADLTDERLGLIARITLVRTAMHGEGDRKGSTYAAVSIGKMKGVDLFERDIQVGVLAMQVPAEWKDRYSGSHALPETTSLPEQLHTDTDPNRENSGEKDTENRNPDPGESVPPSEPPPTEPESEPSPP